MLLATNAESLDAVSLRALKCHGFSDRQIARYVKSTEVRAPCRVAVANRFGRSRHGMAMAVYHALPC